MQTDRLTNEWTDRHIVLTKEVQMVQKMVYGKVTSKMNEIIWWASHLKTEIHTHTQLLDIVKGSEHTCRHWGVSQHTRVSSLQLLMDMYHLHPYPETVYLAWRTMSGQDKDPDDDDFGEMNMEMLAKRTEEIMAHMKRI